MKEPEVLVAASVTQGKCLEILPQMKKCIDRSRRQDHGEGKALIAQGALILKAERQGL